MTRRTTPRWIPTLALASILASGLPTAATAASDGFDALFEHYEPIRQALVDDSIDGLADKARALEGEAEELFASLTPAKAGVDSEDVAAIEELLPEIAQEAAILAETESLEQARAAFYQLSMLMVRYHSKTPVDGVVVAFCPMKKRSWLQPEGEIGNPYSGQAMPRCGEVVSR